MKKRFYLTIGNDEILFKTVDLANDGTPLNEEDQRIFYALSNNPTIVNITNLGYFPYPDSEWDGQNFNCNKDRSLPTPGGVLEMQHFVFLVNNKYNTYLGLNPGVASNDMFIAALSSNPTIKVEVVNE